MNTEKKYNQSKEKFKNKYINEVKEFINNCYKGQDNKVKEELERKVRIKLVQEYKRKYNKKPKYIELSKLLKNSYFTYKRLINELLKPEENKKDRLEDIDI